MVALPWRSCDPGPGRPLISSARRHTPGPRPVFCDSSQTTLPRPTGSGRALPADRHPGSNAGCLSGSCEVRELAVEDYGPGGDEGVKSIWHPVGDKDGPEPEAFQEPLDQLTHVGVVGIPGNKEDTVALSLGGLDPGYEAFDRPALQLASHLVQVRHHTVEIDRNGLAHGFWLSKVFQSASI